MKKIFQKQFYVATYATLILLFMQVVTLPRMLLQVQLLLLHLHPLQQRQWQYSHGCG